MVRDPDLDLGYMTTPRQVAVVREHVQDALARGARALTPVPSFDGRFVPPVVLVDVDPDDCTIATVTGLLAERGDPMAEIDARVFTLDTLLDLAERDESGGLGDLPYPPNYPKMLKLWLGLP